ncbi:HRDC domain-containing protein [Paenibacillus arenilitoris]|uniref:HRDC domain-containing protein n=1 Tax=Paenibacillus arenilitoris TaxID=2772299 RepID=A0A927CSD0_9BACL|nr:HRDC domain-containing protein [Paenibacillus arenilitoris]MBD2872018.1 HRDC domain-containing protein [Paenibacillus arenilitoris]
MQIVFLNTFEKAGEESRVSSAQLSICERQGQWAVLWMERDGEAENPQTWFEGTSWEEMMTAFRHGIAKVMGEGYAPIIDGMLDERRTGAGSFQSMLQCYGELHADPELFQTLREWRRGKASAEKRSAYLIATNRLLWMISAFVPRTEEELAQIPGWGSAKLAAYGQELLAVTAGAQRTTGFPLQWVEDKLDPAAYTAWLFKQKELKYKVQMDRQQAKRQILSAVQRGGTLEQLEAELSMPRRELMDRIEQLEREGYDFEPLIARELNGVPEEEQRLVWDTLSLVGDKYLKPVLQQVYGSAEATEPGKPVDALYERLRLIRLRYRRTQSGKAV